MTKTAVLGRADNSGLATLTRGFCKHMRPEKTLILDFGGSRGETNLTGIEGAETVAPHGMTIDRLERFLDGVEQLVGFETFYNPDVLDVARRRGVKTVLFPMWECTPEWCNAADVKIAVSLADEQRYPGAPRTNWPVDREEFPVRKTAKPPVMFVHNAGSFGLNGRNGTREILKAAKALSGTGASMLVRSGPNIPAEWKRGSTATIAEGWRPQGSLYTGIDVFVFPMRIPGLSLPMLEAAASGLPTLVLDIPENAAYPESMRIKTSGSDYAPIGPMTIEYHRIDQAHLESVLAALAKGEQQPELPPAPATWSDFQAFWQQRIDPAWTR